MKNLRSELQEHRFNAVKGNSRPIDPNQKGRENATQFCNYCRRSGHTPNWCREKIRGKKLKLIENEGTAEKKVTYTQDLNITRGTGYGSERWNRSQDIQRWNPIYINDGSIGKSPTVYQNFSPKQNSAYEHNNSNNRRSFDERPIQPFFINVGNRSVNGFFKNQTGNWRNSRNFFRSPSAERRDFSQNNSYR